MRKLVLAVACIAVISLYGCPPGHVRTRPGPKPKPAPAHVPPGQMKRQATPSGPKPVPPGQMKKAAPAPARVVVAPPLPPLVVFDVEPYYFHEGFFYFLEGDVWYYSDKKDGPKKKLPKDHYPKEVKHKKGKGKSKDYRR